MVSLLLPFMVLLAGAPYNELAKEREGAPSSFPRCSCPFYLIFPPFSLPVITRGRQDLINGDINPESVRKKGGGRLPQEKKRLKS